MSREKLPLFLGDMGLLSDPAASTATALRSAVMDGSFADSKDGLGEFAGHAVTVRTVALVAIAFYGVGRASELAQLLAGDLTVDHLAGAICVIVANQKGDQAGLGQLACSVAVPRWFEAYPARIIDGWMRFRGWLKANKNRCGRKSGNRAPEKEGSSWGRILRLRKNGARVYITKGMPREATQGKGGSKSASVMKQVYRKVRSEWGERQRCARPCTGLAPSGNLRPRAPWWKRARSAFSGAYARISFRQFCMFEGSFAPDVVASI